MTHEFLLNFHWKYSKTRTISNTSVSPDDVQPIRSKSEWGVCRTTSEEKKTFLAKHYGFCRSFKTCCLIAPCVCAAEINCVNYCKNVLERFTAGISPYLEQWLRGPAGWSACASFTPHCRLGLHAFQCAWVHWTRKLVAEQSESKSRGLFSVVSVAADGVSSQNFRHLSAPASSDRLLGSAKPGHTEPSNSSAAKKADDGCQGKGWSCWISSKLTIRTRYCPCFTVFWMKIEQNSCVIVKFNAIWGYWRFMQIKERIFNCTDIQLMHFILDEILKILTYYMPFYH